jgi:ATP-dependent phosphofructokinase / diphosphate-dependent phosphofructokinase
MTATLTKLKGALVVGQSGGPTAVINSSLAGVIEAAGKYPEIEHVYGLVNGIAGLLAEEMIDLGREDAAMLARLPRTPGAALGSCRRKLKAPDMDRVFEVLAAHDVRYFLYAGGNDSMDTCNQVREAAGVRGYPLRVMGIPKTIDNDLACTDHSPGFGTAARFIAQTTQDTGLDLHALRTFVQVVITEIMGRNSGWLAAAASLAKDSPEDPPHLVYVPERAFNEASFLAAVRDIYEKVGYVSVAVSEGIVDAEGRPVGSGSAPTDGFGHQVVALGSGVGPYLAERVKTQLGLTTRCNRPGTIQRVSSAHYVDVDIREAWAAGAQAVHQAVSGDDGYMVTLERVPGPTYVCRTGLAPLAAVANAERLLPDDYIGADNASILPAFRDYALPLIGGALARPARLSSARIPHRTGVR